MAKGNIGESSNKTMKEEKEIAREKQETTTMEPLSPISQLFVLPTINCISFFTLGFQTKCNPSTIVESIKNTWIKVLPRFTSKVEIKKSGKAFWVPVSVRVEDHVIVPDIDQSTIDNPDQFIEDYTSNMANTPMDMTKPLWELHLLNIKTSKSESVCIGKYHHSLGDGLSLMSLLLACSRKTSDPEALPTTAATRSTQVDSKSGSWWFIGRFWLLIIIIFTTFIELFKYLLTIIYLRDTKTPLVGNSDQISPRKIIHRIISFDDVKLVKNSMKMKVNDVLLGMTQAGLSRYLRKKCGKNKVAEKKNIRLRGTVAVNLREHTKIEEFANMMAKGSKHRWGNFVGIVIFPLWIKFEDGPLEYVRRAKSTMDIKKHSMEALFCYGISKFMLKVFGEKVVESIATRLFGHTTLSFSNVMGPDENIIFFEHPVSYVAGSATGGPQVLLIHYVSYANKLIINLSVDTTVIPDPHLLCDDLIESLESIKLAALEKGVHKIEV